MGHAHLDNRQDLEGMHIRVSCFFDIGNRYMTHTHTHARTNPNPNLLKVNLPNPTRAYII